MRISKNALDSLEARAYDFIWRCEYSDGGKFSIDEDLKKCFPGLDQYARDVTAFRLREHLNLKRDLPHFSRQELIEGAPDPEQKSFRDSVFMAAPRQKRWRKLWEVASRDITCTIICDVLIDYCVINTDEESEPRRGKRLRSTLVK